MRSIGLPTGPGLRVKRLGSFGERGLALGMIEASRGLHHTVGALEASELLFIARGSLRANGKILDAHSALRLDRADEGATIEALEDTEVFFIQMPKFPAAMTSTAGLPDFRRIPHGDDYRTPLRSRRFARGVRF